MEIGLSIIRGRPLALLFLLFNILASAKAAIGADINCLKLQQSALSMGKVTVYLSKDALRVNRGDVVTVAHAPDWQITWYNSKKKIVMTESFQKALKVGLLLETSSTAILDVGSPWKKAGPDSVAGLAATKLKNEPTTRASSNAIKNLRYWQYLDKDIPSQEGEWLATCYGVPKLGGIPLRCVYFGKSSAMMPMARFTDDTVGDQTWLDTKDAHRESVPETFFAVPRGYKPTNNVTDLYLAQPLTKDNAMLKELLKDPSTLFKSQ